MISTTATPKGAGAQDVDRCLFCGGGSRRAFRVGDRNRETTQERFDYARCEVCRTLFMVAPPADLSAYYVGDYYSFDESGEPNWKRTPLRIQSAAFRVALLREHAPPGHLIEIGAGTGAFAVTAKAAGFEVSAIEMDERCCRYLAEREGIRAICSDDPVEQLALLPRAGAVAMWHVLEHLRDPRRMLASIADRLEPGGVLALGVPNVDSLQFRLMGKRWPHVDAPRHLCLIPPAALISAGRELGLRKVGMTTTDPEGFDYDLYGWVNALRPHPAQGPPSALTGIAGLAVRRLLAPVERSGQRGSALTLLLRKEQ